MGEFRLGRCFQFRLPHGVDLEAGVQEFVIRENIRAGQVMCVGAVSAACVGFYDHQANVYKQLCYDRPLEISAGTGNVSVRDGKPFVHLHLALTDENGHTTGGHVMSGTTVIACELTVEEFVGPELIRGQDKETGLFLWPEDA